jgi:hypothetical protein
VLSDFRFKVVILVVLCSALNSADAWALSLAPAIFMVQNVTPGKPVDVNKSSGVKFLVKNDGNAPSTFMLQCQKPSVSLTDWERGYDEIPDSTWFKLDQQEFVVPPNTQAEIGLVINVPDKPENYNCKWMLTVVLTSGKKTGQVGVGLAIASRVQIETIPSADPETGGNVSIAPVPSVITIKGKPGDAFERKVQVGNNTDRELECVPGSFLQVYPDDKDYRYPRFTSPGYRLVTKGTWLKAGEEKFSLKPGAKHEFKIAGQIPATAKAGEKWEELVFVTGPALKPGTEGPAGREPRTFIRARYEVLADEAK